MFFGVIRQVAKIRFTPDPISGRSTHPILNVIDFNYAHGSAARRLQRRVRRLSMSFESSYFPRPICRMNSWLSQKRYSSSIVPWLFQRPKVAIRILKAFPVGAIVLPSPIGMG
jgi:hypothetical protein